MEDSLARALAKAQRRERGQILATLIGWCGDFELAEEAFQDALLAAAQHWGREGIPAKPGAWLTTTAGGSVLRPDLCEEAIRLGRLLELLVRENAARLELSEAQRAEILGLLSLMLLIHARRDARVGGQGELIGLEDQDRGCWDRKAIAEGLALLEAAMHLGQTGPYQVQAAIQALHAGAPGPEATDWGRIAGLYEVLLRYSDTAVIRLNRAVAVALAGSPAEGLGMLESLGTELEAYGPYHLARADLLRRVGREAEVLEAYGKALDLTGNARERDFIRRKLET